MVDAKVKAIYEAIDARNYKLSLKLCTTYLSKPKNAQQLVQVLKALTLERLGKADEAEQVCKDVQSQMPTEPTVLDTLVMVYKALGKFNDITKCYENAYNKNPKSEQLLVGLFNSFVRENNYQKQNQTRETPKLLELAQKMMEKVVADDKIKNLESLFIYFSILQQQHDYKKMLELVNKYAPLYKIEEEKLKICAELSIQMKSFKDANDFYMQLLQKFNADDWAYWAAFLDTGFQIASLDASYDFASTAQPFIQSIQHKEQNRYKRGPYLAELALACKREPVEPLLHQYFKIFADKACCAADMKPYLAFLPKERVQEFSESLRRVLEGNEEAVPTAVPSEMKVYRQTTYYLINHLLGIYDSMSSEQKMQVIGELFAAYRSTWSLSVSKEATEVSHSDSLLLLAAFLLQQIASQCVSAHQLIESVIMLEVGLQHSKYNFQMKLMLIALYQQLGALTPAIAHFNLLDIKHILLDTLSYVILDDMITQSHSEQAIHLCRQIRAFHEENIKGTPDFVIKAYAHENFSRIREFMDFKGRLERSQQLAIASTEQTLLELQNNSNTLLEAEAYLREVTKSTSPLSDPQLAALLSNQDYTIIAWDVDAYQWKQAFTSAHTFKQSKDTQSARLKCRSLLPELLKRVMLQQHTELSQLLQEFHSCLVSLPKDSPFALHGQLVSRLLDTSVAILHVSATAESAEFTDSNENPQFKQAQESLQSCASLFSEMGKRLVGLLPLFGPNTFAGNKLAELNCFIAETLCYAYILLETWQKVLPVSRKKKATNFVITELRTLVKTFVAELKQQCQELHSRLTSELSGVSYFDKGSMAVETLKAEEFASVMESTLNQVKRGHEHSVGHLLKVLDMKWSALKSLKF